MGTPIITLLTDFGTSDAYVGAMKGVIATIAPEARVVDLSHDIAPQAVRHGGLVWGAAAPWFPPGTIHVGVIDPGVGSRRAIVAVRTARHTFLAPDNGLLAFALEKRSLREVRRVTRRSLFLGAVSGTFHGRDVFAPVAARLASGMDIAAVGPSSRPSALVWPRVPRPRPRTLDGGVEWRGEIIDRDRFGNLTTNLRPPAGRCVGVWVGALELPSLVRTYAEVPVGAPLATVGSTGRIEIAVREGDAAAVLGLDVGAPVRARWRQTSTG